MHRQGYFLARLLTLLGAVATPLLALQAFNLWESARQAKVLAYRSVENSAAGVAQVVETLLTDTERYLDYLAVRPWARALDSQHCDPLLEGVTQRRHHFANVYVVDATGTLVCASVQDTGQAPDAVA